MEKTKSGVEWEVTTTSKGTGLTCPRCKRKMLVNIDDLRTSRRELHVGASVICPYCECISLVPKQ